MLQTKLQCPITWGRGGTGGGGRDTSLTTHTSGHQLSNLEEKDVCTLKLFSSVLYI